MKYTLLVAMIFGALFLAWCGSSLPSDTQLPSPTTNSGTNVINVDNDANDTEDDDLPEESCVTVITPLSGSTVSFPLEVTISLEYDCWTIFEAQAGVAVISQNGNDISPVDSNNGLMAVQVGYMDSSNYPVTATTMITSLTGPFSGSAEIIITPESPCGDGPECPPTPDPLVIPIMLP